MGAQTFKVVIPENDPIAKQVGPLKAIWVDIDGMAAETYTLGRVEVTLDAGWGTVTLEAERANNDCACAYPCDCPHGDFCACSFR